MVLKLENAFHHVAVLNFESMGLDVILGPAMGPSGFIAFTEPRAFIQTEADARQGIIGREALSVSGNTFRETMDHLQENLLSTQDQTHCVVTVHRQQDSQLCRVFRWNAEDKRAQKIGEMLFSGKKCLVNFDM